MPEKEREGRGAHGTGERLNRHDSRIAKLSKRVNQLEQRIDTAAEVGDVEMSGKLIRICLDNGDVHTGTVVAVSKYKIKIQITVSTELMREGTTVTFNKGKIRWHEELDA